MIRKISVLVLLTLYGAVAIGVPLHYHYCGGELQHISLFTAKECASHDDVHAKGEKSLSCCEGKTISHCQNGISIPDCCDDKTELLQIDESVTALVLLQSNYVDAVITCEFAELPKIVQKEDATGVTIHVVQLKPVLPYLEHCSLIFYG